MMEKYIIFLIFLSSCIVRKIGGGDEFVLKPQKNSILSLNFNLNGAYVCPVKVDDNLSSYIVWFLYTNGVTRSYFCNIRKPVAQINDITIVNSIMQEIMIDSQFKTGGGFEINDNDFKLQEFQIGHYGIYDLWTYSGTVVSDSNLKIYSIKKEKNSAITKSLFFKLIQMPKPDSTNQWMNKNWYWAK